MSLISRSRKQFAVYWDLAGFDNDGQAIYAEPVEIKCRWEDVQEVFPDKEGDDKISKAKVYVDRDVQVEGVLWQGKLEDLTDEDNPFGNSGALKIERRNKIPNMKATEFLRECWL